MCVICTRAHTLLCGQPDSFSGHSPVAAPTLAAAGAFNSLAHRIYIIYILMRRWANNTPLRIKSGHASLSVFFYCKWRAKKSLSEHRALNFLWCVAVPGSKLCAPNSLFRAANWPPLRFSQRNYVCMPLSHFDKPLSAPHEYFIPASSEKNLIV
jgi:hypothetical protein